MAIGLEHHAVVVVEPAVVSMLAGAGLMELVANLCPPHDRAPMLRPVGGCVAF